MSETYNVDLLMQVREKVLTEPEAHQQNWWARAGTDPRKGDGCGTTYCVAGWAAVLDGQALSWQYGEDSLAFAWQAFDLADGRTIMDYAQGALGLSPHEAKVLFRGGNSQDSVLAALDSLIEAGKNGERLPKGIL
jgi:hypothetical protein